ncbi:MAG: SIS domain-containing protein [Elusimicrobia bacterium]|nr:SIS domain-containing protein [Elusimicrobiota bacterium]MDE2424321.1 SIS domain-containing protein [Elusimicrobiota bacterium]
MSAIKGTEPGRLHVTGPGGLDAARFARWYRERTLSAWDGLDLAAVKRLALEARRCERQGRTIWVVGNGGSAATASHLACDLSKTSHVKGRRRIKCVCLNDNAATLTAIANDLGFRSVFSHQLEALAERGDLVVLVSGSGNSPNLLAAAEAARKAGATTAALLGFDGGALKRAVDFHVLVSSDQYGIIEDAHMAIGHIVTFWLKQRRVP